MTLQIRRGTNSQRDQISSSNPILVGELLYVTDQQQLYIGTGEPGEDKGILIAGYTTANVEQLASLFTSGIHSNIEFAYDNVTNTINTRVDLSLYDGEIVAPAIRGSIFADDSSLLINSTTGQIVGDINAKLGGDLDLNSFNITGDGTVATTELLTQQITTNSQLVLTDSGNGRATLKVQSPSAISVVKLSRTATTDISNDNTIAYGALYFERDDTTNGALTTGIINGGNNFIQLLTIEGGNFLDANTVIWKGGKLGVGNITPTEKIDVTGNAVVSGFMKVGSFTDTTRDSLTPSVGMVIYNTTSNKFQGFQNTDGITLEWVNLS